MPDLDAEQQEAQSVAAQQEAAKEALRQRLNEDAAARKAAMDALSRSVEAASAENLRRSVDGARETAESAQQNFDTQVGNNGISVRGGVVHNRNQPQKQQDQGNPTWLYVNFSGEVRRALLGILAVQ